MYGENVSSMTVFIFENFPNLFECVDCNVYIGCQLAKKCTYIPSIIFVLTHGCAKLLYFLDILAWIVCLRQKIIVLK